MLYPRASGFVQKWFFDIGTKGGLRTDVDARVLGADDQPLPGLYATGNASASLSGACYPGPGVPIGTAMVFGWRAVQDMLRAELVE